MSEANASRSVARSVPPMAATPEMRAELAVLQARARVAEDAVRALAWAIYEADLPHYQAKFAMIDARVAAARAAGDWATNFCHNCGDVIGEECPRCRATWTAPGSPECRGADRT